MLTSYVVTAGGPKPEYIAAADRCRARLGALLNIVEHHVDFGQLANLAAVADTLGTLIRKLVKDELMNEASLSRILSEPMSLSGDDIAVAIRTEFGVRGSLGTTDGVAHEAVRIGSAHYVCVSGSATYRACLNVAHFVADNGEAYRAALKSDPRAMRILQGIAA